MEINGIHLGVADLDAGGIGVDLGLYLEAGFGCGCC